jgi:hypothetical protein
MRATSLRVLTMTSLALAAAGARPPRAAAADWPQFNLDSRHSGSSLQESIIHRGNVATLHARYHVALPGGAVADGAPAFLAGVATAQGTRDLLFLNTRSGTLLALDAATGALAWSKQPAASPGITTSSPAVDPNRRFVYAYGLDGKVHKYAVGDGAESTGGGWPEVATLKPAVEKGSAALTVATAADGTAYLYVASSGYAAKTGDYQGHVTTINLATGAQSVFNAMCSDQAVHFAAAGGTPDCAQTQSGVWGRAGVVYEPEMDKIFFATGAGTFDANTGGHDWGDSVLALHPDGTGANGWPLDAYTPNDYQQLQTNGGDLGSSAPAILHPVPATSKIAHLAIQLAKEPEIHLISLDDMSGKGGPGHTGGEVEPVAVPQGGPTLTAPAVWFNPQNGTTWSFIVNDNGIAAMQLFVDASGNPTIFSQWTQPNGGTSPVLANGILFYAAGGVVRALDPMSGNLLWSDAAIGPLHWQSPIVVGGRLYLADENAVLWAYEPAAAPLGFYPLPPCRLLDTRAASGPYGGPSLTGGGARTFAVAGQCGVPADALSVAANVTVVGASSAGYLQVTPADVAGATSAINFSAGQVRANNTVASLTGNPVGSLTIAAGLAAGTAGSVDVLLDISGYFK